jgi:hypothetical protein
MHKKDNKLGLYFLIGAKKLFATINLPHGDLYASKDF